MAALERNATRAFEPLDRILAEGLEPDAATWKAIEKRLATEVKGQLVDMTKAAIRNYRLDLAKREGGLLTWEAVGDDNTCESCDARHGKTKRFAAWERAGLPGSSVLVCCSGPRKPCRCRLISKRES